MNKIDTLIDKHPEYVNEAIAAWNGSAWKALMVIVMRATRLRKLEKITAACDEFLFSPEYAESRHRFFVLVCQYWRAI